MLFMVQVCEMEKNQGGQRADGVDYQSKTKKKKMQNPKIEGKNGAAHH